LKQESVTIKDIAKELGISISTVSRALADNPLVKLKTREQVRAIAKEKNYHPNFNALSLRQRQTKTIGLIIPEVAHEFFADVINGIEDFAFQNGYSLLISCTNNSFVREQKSTFDLLNGKIDGLLACLTMETTDVKHYQEFIDRKVPLVFFDCVSDNIDADKVIVDDKHAGYTATSHLVNVGCKRIAYVGGPLSLLNNQHRFEGYKSALIAAGQSLDDKLVVHCNNGNFEQGKKLAAKLFEYRENYPDGIFAGTDMLAVGAMKNIKEAGLRIPEDVAVVGFSNWEISEIYEPSLTTIDQQGKKIGETAIKKLLQRIQSDVELPIETTVIKTLLIQRESTKRVG
jgi:LacI family transcriptional regulator